MDDIPIMEPLRGSESVGFWSGIDVLNCVIGFSWIMYVWESYLSYRQRRLYKNTTSVPPELADTIDDTTFQKARAYSIDKSHFGFWSGLWSQVEGTMILVFGGIPYVWGIAADFLSSVDYSRWMP
jgi:STE24 endopeptidase